MVIILDFQPVLKYKVILSLFLLQIAVSEPAKFTHKCFIFFSEKWNIMDAVSIPIFWVINKQAEIYGLWPVLGNNFRTKSNLVEKSEKPKLSTIHPTLLLLPSCFTMEAFFILFTCMVDYLIVLIIEHNSHTRSINDTV